MKVRRDMIAVHPLLVQCVEKVEVDIIKYHSMPIRLFESSREHGRHNQLIQRGKTKDLISRHLYDVENVPHLYTTAIDYVHYDGKWSWNLRDLTIKTWYELFGHMVLDLCPELEWCGMNRKSVNYCHFQLTEMAMYNNLDKFPCVMC